MMNEPVANGIYSHFKGNLYIVLGVGAHTENGEVLVCYRDLNDESKVHFRPLKDHPKAWLTPQDNGEPRFERLVWLPKNSRD